MIGKFGELSYQIKKNSTKGTLHIRKCLLWRFRKFVMTVGYDEFVGITKYNWRKLQ